MHSLSRALLIVIGLALAGRAQDSVPLSDTPPSLALPPLPKLSEAPAPSAVEPQAVPAPAAAKPKDAPRGSSTTGQFVIHGGELLLRTEVGQRCDDVAERLRRLLRDGTEWRIPVVLSLRDVKTPAEAGVNTAISQITGGGFHLQVNVLMAGTLDTMKLETELVRILLAERILRDHSELTTTRSRILPDWLLIGVQEALHYRQRARPSATFAVIFKSGKLFGIEDILDESPTGMDALSRAVYETSACALVLTLIDQPEGNLRLAKFLNSLAVETRSDRELIRAWFPGLGTSKTSLEKWWSLQLANLSRPSVFESLGPKETDEALTQALSFRLEVQAESEPVVAKVTPTARPKPKPSASSAATKEAEEPKEDAPQSTWLNRLFTRGEEKPKPEKKEEPKPEAKKPEPKPAVADTGLFNRIFGKGDEPVKKPESKPAPKPAPKPEKKEEPKASGGVLRRLFSGDKSEADKKKQSALPLTQSVMAAVMLPRAAEWLLVASDALRPASPVQVAFLGFGKKKDPEATKAETAKKAAEKAAAAKAKAEAADAEKKLEAKRDALKQAEKDLRAAEREAERKTKATKEPPEEPKPEPAPAKKPTPAPTKAASKPSTPKPTPTPEPVVRNRTVSGIPLEDYAKVLKRPDAKQVIDRTAAGLMALEQQAHPLFRPLIKDYLRLLEALHDGQTKGVDDALKALSAARAKALAKAREMQDYLDWFEANNGPKWSGTFDDYLRVEQAISEELPKRTDSMAKFLDEVEAEQAAKK